ncbi:MAG: four helix bundle protein [Dehalococcoidia bacterium]|nr:four helix bundle protein [Dehalococcoidia bacterium]
MGSEERRPGYHGLQAYQKADDLAVAIYSFCGKLPARARFLADQSCRAAVSVPANIAEGYDRKSPKEYLRALWIARGSLAEVEYYIHFMQRVKLVDHPTAAGLENLRGETARLLFSLIRALRLKYEGTDAGGTLREGQAPYGEEGASEADVDPMAHDSMTP